MTAPQSFTRRSARVEAMRLDSVRKLVAAEAWLVAHGLRVSRFADWMMAVDSNGARLSARLGQWLTYNPDSGEFTSWSHENFLEEHPEAREA